MTGTTQAEGGGRGRGTAARAGVELSRAVRVAHGGAGQAAAGRPVRADQFRRQPDHAGARRGLLAAPRPFAPGRARLHPGGRADAGHQRRRDRAAPGMAAGFKAGTQRAPLVNRTERDVVYLESATAPRATRWSTPTTTSAPPSPTIAGASSTRTAGPIEAAPVMWNWVIYAQSAGTATPWPPRWRGTGQAGRK